MSVRDKVTGFPEGWTSPERAFVVPFFVAACSGLAAAVGHVVNHGVVAQATLVTVVTGVSWVAGWAAVAALD